MLYKQSVFIKRKIDDKAQPDIFKLWNNELFIQTAAK